MLNWFRRLLGGPSKAAPPPDEALVLADSLSWALSASRQEARAARRTLALILMAHGGEFLVRNEVIEALDARGVTVTGIPEDDGVRLVLTLEDEPDAESR